MRKSLLTFIVLALFVAAVLPSASTRAAGAQSPPVVSRDPLRRYPILQFFGTRWRDIQRRLPEIVSAGYSALWLPPPQKASTGRVSVGFDPADRFDLGDRFQYGSVETQYGSAHDLIELVNEAHRLGVEIYFDTVPNHNGNRVATSPNGYPDVIPQDFHIRSVTGLENDEIRDFRPFSFQIWNNDLLGLADFAQEDGNKVLPANAPLPPGVVLNAFGKPSFVRHPNVPQYYPDGTPAAEDIREFLNRWGWFLGNRIGADGFRLDAVKHAPPPFWGGPSSFTSPTDGVSYTVSSPQFVSALQSGVMQRARKDAYIYGEVLSGDGLELGAYAQTGMRLLDFPLRFNVSNVFNSNGFGNLGPSFDNNLSTFGVGFEYGGIDRQIGVTFVHSHDDPAPTSNNLATAYTLTRVGRPIVYFDGNNIPDGSDGFPKPGRTDSLGEGSDVTKTLVSVHNQFSRGNFTPRFSTSDLFIFERSVSGRGVMLVGMNDRGDRAEFGTQTATVQTSFAPGTVLLDYSGQMPPVTVGGDGRVTISVPTNNDPSNDPPNPPPPSGVFCNDNTCFENNGRGYVLYAPATPQAMSGVAPVAFEQGGAGIPFQSFPTADGVFADPQPNTTFQAPIVTGETFTLRVRTNSLGARAVVRIDDGVSINNRVPLSNTEEGLSEGFVEADVNGPGDFSIADIDTSNLTPGLHVARVLVFAPQAPNQPPMFNLFTQTFFVNKPSRNAVTVDGVIAGDFGARPEAVQTVAPADADRGVNELQAMFIGQDAKNLYIGIPGKINGAEGGNSLNGVAVFIDTDFGRNTGLTDFGQLNDDSGPATRLLSNASVIAPPGFGAEMAVASFRGGGLNASPVAPFVSDFGMTPSVGARAGVYRINPANLRDLTEASGFIAFDPRSVVAGSSTGQLNDADNGMEIAIRLDDLFPNFDGDRIPGNDNEDGGFPASARIGLVAYIVSTGETGEVTGAANLPGGRPPAVGVVKNQFLPAHPELSAPPVGQPIRLLRAVVFSKTGLRR
jgi:glycosidase